MARIVVIHDVQDLDDWLKYKTERADVLATTGVTDVVDHVAHDGSKTVAITANSDDVDAIVAATASPAPELMDAMQRHGVIPPLKIFVGK
jgi:hypothetical protein